MRSYIKSSRALKSQYATATGDYCKNARIQRGRHAPNLGRHHYDLMVRPSLDLSQRFNNQDNLQGLCKTVDRYFSRSSIPRTMYSNESIANDTSYTAGTGDKRDVPLIGTSSMEKISLKGVEQTLLPMVLFKARDYQNTRPILGDPYAKQLLHRCDIDLNDTHFSFTTDERYVTWIANRAKRFDQWCQEFLNAHQKPVTVLHLGCGLDCRYFRLERRREAAVRWIDLDQEMVVDLRSRLIPGLVGGGYTLQATDVTKHEWYRNVPADRPTMIIAEGLMPYLEPEQGKKLIRDLVEYFGTSAEGHEQHGQLVFDTLGSLSIRLTQYIKALRSSKAAFKWGIDEPEEIQALHSRLKLKDQVLWHEYMDNHPPFFGKYGTIAASLMPSFKKNIQFWRLEF